MVYWTFEFYQISTSMNLQKNRKKLSKLSNNTSHDPILNPKCEPTVIDVK